MSDRADYLKAVKSVVIKLGTQLLADKQGRLDAAFLSHIAEQVVELRKKGILTTIVSSGAVGAGLRELNLASRPTDLATLQAVAAVGQRKLMDAWAEAFKKHSLPVAQLLLTREDIDHRTRFLNLRNTIHAIHDLSAIPIINENDTVSTDEIVKISFGDNDILASLVAHAMEAQMLVLLSVVDGVLDADGQSVRLIDSIEAAQKLVRAEKSALGKGGMTSKLMAARTLTESGECLVVADGRMPSVLPRIFAGEAIGTLFAPSGKKRSSRSRWIGSVRPSGSIHVDSGAVTALTEKHRSLLAAGVTQVEGQFDRGAVVAIRCPDNQVIAKGLSNYSSHDLEQIKGKKTSEVRALLAERAYDEVVHCDNMVVG